MCACCVNAAVSSSAPSSSLALALRRAAACLRCFPGFRSLRTSCVAAVVPSLSSSISAPESSSSLGAGSAAASS
eukprot:CAMPEP_0179338026 /NCGR_PEP_ID=MMETSP0797-20121207/67959_1 /TAXON_ID=47934 /ORGANISM="Dinophysis acuminata, Strain DAEP01" /LENGTH=73 /DNA_ID=CAMNT_0021051757 /DNA_START=48 /DNA_END=266 /DNA_ORIENTATION=+